MKKAILFTGMVCMATSALAFGGGGSGHDSARYNRHSPGVDNFGVHIHPDNPPLDIRFYDIKNDANAQPCQEGANVYCCKAGYVVDVATSKCVPCPAGSVATLDENFKCTLCSDIEQPDAENAVCEQIEPIVTLTQTVDESTFFYKQPSFVNGTLTEVGHGSWKAIATDGELVTIDYTVDSNGNIQETIWYPDNKQEIEETPLKQGDFFSFLKQVFVKKAYANTSDRRGLNTEEWEQFALRLDCDGVTSSWRSCFCVGKLALQEGKYVCTCPDGGVSKGRDCCKDGYSYNQDTKKYDTVSPESATVCGCPSGTTKVQHMFCCDTQGNAVWGIDKKEQFPICFSQIACPNGLTPNLTTGVCECPNGGSWGTDGQTCCKDNLAYNNETQDYTVSKTQVCCEATSGMKWCASNDTCIDDTESCPCAGEQPACQKCEDGAWVADTEKNDQPCGVGVCTDGKCCQGEICAEAGQELYCSFANGQGECGYWSTCAEGKSSGDSIEGVSSAIGACAGEKEELYCFRTSAKGECEWWETCAEGKSSKDWIVGVKSEYGGTGACADERYEVFCGSTNDQGECYSWSTCPKGKESTKDWIVGMPNAFGACASNDGDDLYCAQAGPSGCNGYSVCTVDGEVGKDLEAYAKQTGHDVGGEVCCPEGKVYCQVAFLDGTCEHHACQAYYEGELTQGIYIDLDVICPSAATPYIFTVEMMDGPRFEGRCCYGTVQPGDAYQGIGDTCIE